VRADRSEEGQSSRGTTSDDAIRETGQPEAGLRKKVLQGGAFLAFRQAIGVVLSLAGVLLVTRVIGPRQYGIFAMAMGIVTFLYMLGTWGIDIYLLRKTEKPSEHEFNQGFTVLLCISSAFFLALAALSHLIASFVKTPAVAPLMIFLAAAIPFNLLALPAIVKLDRDLNFRQVAINELLGQASMYVIAIPLALAGAGAWAPASGFVLQQFVLMMLSYASARYKPSLCWDSALVLRMLKYGLAYSSSIWVWQLRGLVNPLIVSRLAGAEAVGYIAVSIRFVEVLAFAKQATWRIAMAALAKISQDGDRLRNSVSEGMKLQAMAVGFPLALFALTAPILIPLGLGHNWTPALVVFPFIAVSYLTNAMFNLHSSVLYLREQNFQVTIFHTVHIVLFAGSTALLVPRLGFVGYGWAELVALLSYPVLHTYFARQVDSPSYTVAALWFATTSCVLAVSCMRPPFLYLGFAALLLPWLFPKERASMLGYAKILFPWMGA
jgi:O-antigen/teichoic acid export membrane protein